MVPETDGSDPYLLRAFYSLVADALAPALGVVLVTAALWWRRRVLARRRRRER
jgi:hypothetical protein